jgi:hypothetical protein
LLVAAKLFFASRPWCRDVVVDGHVGCASTGDGHCSSDFRQTAGFIDPSCRGDVDGEASLFVRNRNEREEVQLNALVTEPLVDFFEQSIFERPLVEFDDIFVGEEFADQVAQSLVDDGIFRRFILRAAVGFILRIRVGPTDVFGFTDEGFAVNDRVFVGNLDIGQDLLLERGTKLRFAIQRVVGDGDGVRAGANLNGHRIAGRDEIPANAAVAGDQRLLVGLGTVAPSECRSTEGEDQNGLGGSSHDLFSAEGFQLIDSAEMIHRMAR